jgi:hypothetical protein
MALRSCFESGLVKTGFGKVLTAYGGAVASYNENCLLFRRVCVCVFVCITNDPGSLAIKQDPS